MLSGSVQDVNVALRQDHSQLFHHNVFGQTALHFAIRSPTMMEAILRQDKAKSLVNISDIYGQLPLEYARVRACLATVQMLLESDSRIDWEMLELTARTRNFPLLTVLLHHLRDRSERLEALARRHGKTRTLDASKFPKDGPMNCQVHKKVFKELTDASIKVLKSLRFDSLKDLR